MIGEDFGAEAIISDIQPLSMSDMKLDDEWFDSEDSASTSDGKPAQSKKPKSKSKEAMAVDGYSKDESVAGVQPMPQVDVRGALDGYNITSFAKSRAIVGTRRKPRCVWRRAGG